MILKQILLILNNDYDTSYPIHIKFNYLNVAIRNIVKSKYN